MDNLEVLYFIKYFSLLLLLLLHTLFKDASPDNQVKVDFHGGRQYKNIIHSQKRIYIKRSCNYIHKLYTLSKLRSEGY